MLPSVFLSQRQGWAARPLGRALYLTEAPEEPVEKI
jgi:hypothetical protein